MATRRRTERALWRLCMVVLVAALMVGWHSRAGADAVAEVDSAGLAELLEQGVTIVDIRRPDEWRETGVIDGSVQITAVNAEGRLVEEFPAAIATAVGRDEPVAIICRSGNRSALIARMMSEHGGYTRVIDAAGGIRAWLDADLPVVPCSRC